MPRIDIEAFEDEWDDDGDLFAPRSRELSQKARERIDQLEAARVVGVDRGRVTLLYRGEETDARLAGTMRGQKAVVGDQVRVRPPRHEDDTPRIVELLPRATVLTRTADDDRDLERVVVANAEQVVVVVAADHLLAGTRFLDRVMVSASVGRLDAAMCVNRIDLVTDRRGVDEACARYAAIGVSSCVTSAVTGEGIDGLRELLADRWSAFTGHSGVGKTALFNILVPDAGRRVGEMGRYGGRHTTTSSRAMRIPGADAWLVDTPGVRSFGLGIVDPRELRLHFPELAGLPCDLDDCVHDTEPGCALPSADVHPERLASYRRLLAALREAPRP